VAKKIGACHCTFGGLRQDFTTGDMEMVFKIHKDSRQRAKKISDAARELDLTISIEKYAEKRSLDANSYFWLLAGKLAPLINTTKEEIYREYIKGIGDNFEIVPVRLEARDKWIRNWESNGIGWVCEDLGTSDSDGYTNVICYFGSSTYDAHQMYQLIQLIIFDCEEQGIETATPDELARIKGLWDCG